MSRIRSASGELVGRAMHDLRNSLASITGCTETLIRQESRIDPEARRALLEVIRRQAYCLDRLVLQLGGDATSSDAPRSGAW